MTIPDELSIGMVYRLLHEEGLYIGASSALNVVGAYELAKKLGPGTSYVSLLTSRKLTQVCLQAKLLLRSFVMVPIGEHELWWSMGHATDFLIRYQTRLFSKKWLETKGLAHAIPAELQKYVVLP